MIDCPKCHATDCELHPCVDGTFDLACPACGLFIRDFDFESGLPAGYYGKQE